jgi:16S rRNA C967 or C1407 C5-methylase (RsmB/RsmF family)/NOL1/NOP2/fmu family ribosome biogenesis protein
MNLPKPFLETLTSKIGVEEIIAFKEQFEKSVPVSIRFNPKKGYQETTTNAVPWCPLGKYLDERPSFTLDPSFHAGKYYVQEASSMFLWHVLESLPVNKNEIKVLDLCAAPGGKSTLISAWLNGKGLLCANEVIKNRAYTLKYNISKEGHNNVVVTHNDPKDFTNLDQFFDVILVDAPCSGEGMFRKDPASMSEWSEDNVGLCCSRQKRILADVLPALKNNGYLIYSTCTYNDDENIRNIEWVKENYNLQSIRIPIKPEWNIIEEHQRDVFGYQFYPHKIQGEGFFISVVQKDNASTSALKLKHDQKTLKKTENIHKSLITPWIDIDGQVTLIDKNQTIHAIPENMEHDVYILHHYLRIINCGADVGSLNKNILIPNHGLALAIQKNPNIPAIHLGKNDALKYLKKELELVDSDQKSWNLVCYDGLGIGWLKNLGNRINNYLPSEYRILMKID